MVVDIEHLAETADARRQFVETYSGELSAIAELHDKQGMLKSWFIRFGASPHIMLVFEEAVVEIDRHWHVLHLWPLEPIDPH